MASKVAARSKFIGSWYFIVIEIAALVTMIGIGTYFALGGTVHHKSTEPNLKIPNSTFYNAISQKTTNVSVVNNMISGNLNNYSQVSIRYSGNATAKSSTSGAIGGLGSLGVDIPIDVWYTKYRGDSRFDIKIHMLGSLNISFFTIDGIQYLCSSGEPGGASSINGAYTPGGGASCVESNPNLRRSNVSSTSVTTFIAPVRNIAVHDVVQSEYNGDQCTLDRGTFSYVPGLGSVGALNTSISTNVTYGNYSICFSNARLVPDTLNVTMGGSGYTVALNMDLESMNYTSSDSYVTTLPGPVKPLTT
jgi:hypothetical protein